MTKRGIITSTRDSGLNYRLIAVAAVLLAIMYFAATFLWGWGSGENSNTIRNYRAAAAAASQEVPALIEESEITPDVTNQQLDIETVLDAVDARFQTLADLHRNNTPEIQKEIEYIEVEVERIEYVEVPGPTRYIESPPVERIVEVEVPVEVERIVEVERVYTPGNHIAVVCVHVENATAIRLEAAQHEFGLPGGQCIEVPASGHYTEYKLIVTR